MCSESSQSDEGASEISERQEGLGEFLIARTDASEETLDQIAAPVDCPSNEREMSRLDRGGITA